RPASVLLASNRKFLDAADRASAGLSGEMARAASSLTLSMSMARRLLRQRVPCAATAAMEWQQVLVDQSAEMHLECVAACPGKRHCLRHRDAAMGARVLEDLHREFRQGTQ